MSELEKQISFSPCDPSKNDHAAGFPCEGRGRDGYVMNNPRATVKVTADVMTDAECPEENCASRQGDKGSISKYALLQPLPLPSLCTRGAILQQHRSLASKAVALGTWLKVILHCHPPADL